MLLLTGIFAILPLILGLRLNSVTFAVDYFKERNAPHVCVLSCDGEEFWLTKFIKEASSKSLMVSNVQTSGLSKSVKINRCMKQKFTNIGVLIDARCNNTKEVFNIASHEMWFDFRHIWLIVDDRNSPIYFQNGSYYNNFTGDYVPKIIKELETMNISVDADIVLAKLTGPQFYNLYDIFNFGKVQGGDLKVIDIGFWSWKKGLAADLKSCKYYRRWDFGGWKMRLVSVITSPLKDFYPEMLTAETPVPGVSVITRTSTTILMVVAELHNIQFVHQVTDRWISTFERNNSKNAAAVALCFRDQDITSVLRFYITMLDKVTLIHPSLTSLEFKNICVCQQNAAAVALCFRDQDITSVLRFYITMLDKVTLIHPSLTSLETRYYYRIPTTGPGKFENEFLRPLSSGTWWSLVGVSIICVLILVLAALFERRPTSVQYAFFTVVASVCQQYFEDEHETRRISSARKLTIFITGMSCVIIYNYYTSSVVSWLLNGPPPSLSTLRELLDSPLDLILEDIGYTRSWLNNPDYYFSKAHAKDEDALRKKVLSKRSGAPLVKLVEEGIAMVKAGGYAYHTETNNANRLISETFTKSELCEVGSLQSMAKTLLYPGIQKDSPYKEFLTWSLTRLLERGIVSCIQRRTLSLPIHCEASMPRALALGGAAPAFILLALGFVLATGIMFFERLVYKLKNKPKKIKMATIIKQYVNSGVKYN